MHSSDPSFLCCHISRLVFMLAVGLCFIFLSILSAMQPCSCSNATNPTHVTLLPIRHVSSRNNLSAFRSTKSCPVLVSHINPRFVPCPLELYNNATVLLDLLQLIKLYLSNYLSTYLKHANVKCFLS